MIKKLTIGIYLIYIASSLGCIYYTQSSCTSVGCTWSNSTCIVGSGICQEGWSYYSLYSQCVQCSTLGNSNCTSICPKYFYSSTSNFCQSCASFYANCITCSVTQCNTCVTGFSVDPAHTTECLIDFCKIRFCNKCETNKTCFLCKTGYNTILNGTFCSTSICSISNCLFCVDSSTCVACLTQYQLTQTSTSCIAVCRDAFCQSCSSPSVCTSCLSGYRFSSDTGNCKLDCKVPLCTTCDLSTTCTGCSSGYEVNSAYTLCNPICTDANCATCTTPTKCVECDLGYSLIGGVCTKDMCYIQSCQTCQTSITCKTCDTISTLSSDKKECVQNCFANIQNCRTCQTNTRCSTCKAGYQLSTDKKSCAVACIVSYCFTCLTNTLCSYCRDGYITSNGGASCLFNCGIANCDKCKSTTTCETCSSPYTLSSTSTSCSLICSPGFYASSSNGLTSCLSCSTAKSNCLTCRSSTSSSSIICSVCQLLYYLTSVGDCVSCSSKISNCLFCIDPINCLVCKSDFNLVLVNGSYGCYSPSACDVANCKICSINNPLICTQCYSAYSFGDSTNTTCTRITCLDIQYYDSTTLTCTCPFGTFVSNRKCSYCDLDNCVTCNSGGCLTCKSSYYVNQGSCKKCSNNCLNCTSGTSCIECGYGYAVQSSGQCKKADQRYSSTEVAGSTAMAVCPAGCSQCTYNQGLIYCTIAKDGYAIDPSGKVIKCSDECLTCINSDSSICTSCYGASTLINGACKGCADVPYAIACPDNYKYSTACIINYSPINGVCKKCAADCITCGKAGEGQCDDNGCSPGYVKLATGTNCTKCFSSCSACSKNNPSVCISCGVSNFLSSNTSKCTSCPSVCLTCTSADVCTTCPQSYTFDSDWCYPTIGKPCATQSKSVCTSCFLGYNFVDGTCTIDNSCNATKTCSTCDKGFYLITRQCLPCRTDTTCDYCDPTIPSNCLYCATGYYLRKNDISCKSCGQAQTGCTLCLSNKACTAAADGYFLEVDVYNVFTGTVKACKSGCETCNTADSCLTCATDYNKIGTTCLYNKNVQAKLTLGTASGSSMWFSPNNTDEQNLANAYLQLNQIISAIASISNISDLDRIIILSLQLGSLITDMVIASSPTQDFNDFSSNFQQKLDKLPDFQVLSSSVSVNGASSTSSANLGLILGVTVPLLALLAVIIIFVKIYLGDQSDDKTTQQTQKQIQEIQM